LYLGPGIASTTTDPPVALGGQATGVANLGVLPSPLLQDAVESVADEAVKFLDDARLQLEEPLEEGIGHPLENVLQSALSHYGDRVGEWVGRLPDHDDLRPQLLIALARVAEPKARPWLRELASKCLQSDGTATRYAAIKALEHWRDETSTALLRSHHDSREWLADYVRRVVARR
jgi:HEAT repeat protein